jgi:AcrR family transcriptional regulator
MGTTEGRPRGEEEDTEAVIAAATRLFVERGPAATSLRQIASEAGVNHGLIHRHFGTKRELVRAVYERLSSRLAATRPFETVSLEAALEAFHTLEGSREFWMVLTRAMLDGELEEVLASELPGGHEMVTKLAVAMPADAPLSAPDVVAMSFAFSLGWLLLREFIQTATGAGDDVPEKWFTAMASLLSE